MAHKEYGCIGMILFVLFFIIGLIIGSFFPEPSKTYIIITFIVIGIILMAFMMFFGRPIYLRIKQKPFKGEEQYLICPECNIQVEKATGVCPNCGKNLLYSSKIKAE